MFDEFYAAIFVMLRNTPTTNVLSTIACKPIGSSFLIPSHQGGAARQAGGSAGH